MFQRVREGVLLVLLASCAAKTNSITKECRIPSDQSQTITGQWTSRPVPIALVTGEFSDTEVSQMKLAINTWNNFFKASKGYPVFLYVAPVSSTSTLLTEFSCDSPILTANQWQKPVFIRKVASNWTFSSSAMAITSTCSQTASPYSRFYSARMVINYQHFFTGSNPKPDLQSILLHELGHLFGVDHSCFPGSKIKGKPPCETAPPEYKEAVMAPTLGFTSTREGLIGKIKVTPETNDQQRANCLY